MKKLSCFISLTLFATLFFCGSLQASQKKQVVPSNEPDTEVQVYPNQPNPLAKKIKSLSSDEDFFSKLVRVYCGKTAGDVSYYTVKYGKDVAVYGGLGFLCLSQFENVPLIGIENILHGKREQLQKVGTSALCGAFGYLYYKNGEMNRRFDEAKEDREKKFQALDKKLIEANKKLIEVNKKLEEAKKERERIAKEDKEDRKKILEESQKERKKISNQTEKNEEILKNFQISLRKVDKNVITVDNRVKTLAKEVKKEFEKQNIETKGLKDFLKEMDEKTLLKLKELLSVQTELKNGQKKIQTTLQNGFKGLGGMVRNTGQMQKVGFSNLNQYHKDEQLKRLQKKNSSMGDVD